MQSTGEFSDDYIATVERLLFEAVAAQYHAGLQLETLSQSTWGPSCRRLFVETLWVTVQVFLCLTVVLSFSTQFFFQ